MLKENRFLKFCKIFNLYIYEDTYQGEIVMDESITSIDELKKAQGQPHKRRELLLPITTIGKTY